MRGKKTLYRHGVTSKRNHKHLNKRLVMSYRCKSRSRCRRISIGFGSRLEVVPFPISRRAYRMPFRFPTIAELLNPVVK